MTGSPRHLVTIATFAEHAGDVHHQTVRNWIKKGILPAYRLPGGGLRIDLADLDKIIVPVEVGERP